MAHIEIQIANTALLQGLLQLLTPRLYAQCFVSPVTGLMLDHLEAGTIGPAVPTAAGVTVPVRVGVILVFVNDVIAANGGPAVPPAKPQLTGNILLTIAGTTLTATFGGVSHDAAYQILLALVAGQVGQAKADALFAQWEADVQKNLGSTPLLVYDFGSGLPPQLKAVPFGRSALSADGTRVAIRIETGAPGSDGDWSTFLSGVLDDHLQGNAWGLFVGADAVVQVANAAITAAVAGHGGVLKASNWAPQGETPAVNSSVSMNIHVHVELLGVTLFDGDVPVVLSLTTKFTMPTEGVLRTDISYDYQIQGGFIAEVEDFVAHALGVGSDIVVPPGYTQAGDREFFEDTEIPIQVLEFELTLSATGVLASPDGMLLGGRAAIVPALAPPDCNVDAREFALQYFTFCSSYQNHDQGPPNANNVTATATIIVSESLNKNELPLIIGGFALVQSVPADAPPGTPPDPQQQFAPFLPAVPQQVGSGSTYEIMIPVSKVSSGYLADEYPCQLIVLTNGGVRYLSLGEIPAPIFDKRTGYVTNTGTLYVNDCHFGRLNPYALVVSLLNLVDPSPEGVVELGQAVERAVVEGLANVEAGGILPVTVGGRQVGTVSINSVMENQISHVVLGGAARTAGAVVTVFVQRTAGAGAVGVLGNQAAAGAKKKLTRIRKIA